MVLSIAIVGDFFLPRLGGVEIHMWSLAQGLLRKGHKVVIITHSYGKRCGVRYMTNGLKVYYLQLRSFYEDNSFPTFFLNFPILRDILIREEVEIVHGHGAASSLMNETLFHSKTLKLKTVYTDHSLFGFSDLAGVHLNKVLKFSTTCLDAAIAVSHVCKENLILRTQLPPDCVFTIPNAVDSSAFYPDKVVSDADMLNIIVVGRLAHRKGITLLVELIPLACSKFPQVRFLIGGAGPLRLLLEEMVERHQLHDRVEILGGILHSDVRSLMCRGRIFLNCSLTESFGSAIIEAASCGLFIVSTGVGGVPEILPPDMIKYTKTHDVDNLLTALCDAIEIVQSHGLNPTHMHQTVKSLYSWEDVTARTIRVYRYALKKKEYSLSYQIRQYCSVGPISGILSVLLQIVDHIFLFFLEVVRPSASIDRARCVRPYLKKNEEIDEQA